MSMTKLAVTLAGLMCAVSSVAYLVTPSTTAKARGSSIQLESAIPKQFGEWHEEEASRVQVVNPQAQQLLDKLYSQVLTRNYVDTRGNRVMLSVAYGDDQRGGLQAHKPEICYPAQGFTLRNNLPAEIETPYGKIPGRRLETELGGRVEPVTYWFAVASRAVSSRFEYRLAEIRVGLTGQVPDGVLFRVSSIDSDSLRAYQNHDRFVGELLAAVTSSDRERLSGLASAQ